MSALSIKMRSLNLSTSIYVHQGRKGIIKWNKIPENQVLFVKCYDVWSSVSKQPLDKP